jgi:hypothetical protein
MHFYYYGELSEAVKCSVSSRESCGGISSSAIADSGNADRQEGTPPLF